MHTTKREAPVATSTGWRRARVRALAATLVALALAACGGASPPARPASFVVFDWRVDTEADPPGGLTASWDVWKDDGGPGWVQLTSAEPSHVWSFEPAVSPDGTTIAFIGVEDVTAYSHVFTMFNNGFGVRQVTFGPVHDLDPAWSPTGRRLAFSSDRGGSQSIWTIDRDGSGPWRVTTAPDGDDDGKPTYSPDGLRIAFHRGVSRDAYDVWVANAWIGGLKRLTASAGSNMDPAWKPDGTRIAFESNRFGGGFRIFQMSPDGAGQTKTDPLPGAGTDVSHFRPTWTVDGLRIWFVARFEPGGLQGDQSIHSMKADGGDELEEETMILPSELDHPDLHP